MKTIIKSIFVLVFFLFFLNSIFADNWVCYDETGTATASELRNQFKYVQRIQPESPLQIIRTGNSASTYTQSSYFTSCSNSNTFNYCPENEYYLKTSFGCAKSCIGFRGAHHQYQDVLPGVNCGLGGGPYCIKFVDVGNCSEVVSQEFVCGKNNNLWKSMTSSDDWICPNCQELSKRYETEPIMGNITSFRDLSFGGGVYRYSNVSVDLSFMVYILACINRVPMLNLEVNLIDTLTNKVVNTEYGIYAKHETLDYNEDNMGMLREFKIPYQEEFRRRYILNATLSGYRAWAWRQRLVDSIDKVVQNLGLDVPGYPDILGNQKFDDLYYSSDFLVNTETIRDVEIGSNQVSTQIQKASINVLKNINWLEGYRMCTVSDLQKYIRDQGVTSQFLDQIDSIVPLVDGADYSNLRVLERADEIAYVDKENIKIKKSRVGDLDDFVDELNDRDLNEKYDFLKSYGYINEDEIMRDMKSVASFWFDYSPNLGCNNYEYEFRNLDISEININYDEDDLYLDLRFSAIWENNIVADLEIDYEIERDIEYAWNFATLKNLNPQTLAKCLYHWDECIIREVSFEDEVFKEVADCGLGPPSGLAEPSMKDGARGKKSITQDLVVYRECNEDDEWISAEGIYTCVNKSYYKCRFGLSADEALMNVISAKVGNTLKRKNGKGYVCMPNGDWKKIDCLS